MKAVLNGLILSLLILFVSCTSKEEGTRIKEEPYCTNKGYKNRDKIKYTEVDLNDTLDYLVALKEGEKSYAYVNTNGDTIIPINKYSSCYTDTLWTFGFFYNKDLGRLAGVDKRGEVLFDAVLFDNVVERVKDGMLIVEQNGLMGFANKYGEIVIPCQYECASSFNYSVARVSKVCCVPNLDETHESPTSDNSIYINKEGETVYEKGKFLLEVSDRTKNYILN